MAISPLKEQLLKEIEKLSPDQQEQTLAFARRLGRPRGVSARSLLRFAGRISPDDIEKMEQAIEDCEKIDPNEW
ncbi:MAG: hypothetical protein K8I30_09060 [Anaerolineae bacterium]|nr:hypothetical protein [Anaerolineae bacterium]